MTKCIKKRRHIRRTSLIIVAEGFHDKAFLNHMKDLYDEKQIAIKIGSADGGSPKDIIEAAINKTRNAEYDYRYILMDADIPVSKEEREYAKKNNIELIFSEPLCLEGMLLKIIGQKPASTSQKCKSKLHPQLSGPPSDKGSYKAMFNRQVLDSTQIQTIVELRNILSKTS